MVRRWAKEQLLCVVWTLHIVFFFPLFRSLFSSFAMILMTLPAFRLVQKKSDMNFLFLKSADRRDLFNRSGYMDHYFRTLLSHITRAQLLTKFFGCLGEQNYWRQTSSLVHKIGLPCRLARLHKNRLLAVCCILTVQKCKTQGSQFLVVC